MLLQYVYIMLYNTSKSMHTSLLTSLIQKCTFFVNVDRGITTWILYSSFWCWAYLEKNLTTGLTGFKTEHCNDTRMRCTVSSCSHSLCLLCWLRIERRQWRTLKEGLRFFYKVFLDVFGKPPLAHNGTFWSWTVNSALSAC